jgi:hypothetical protein
VCGGTRAAFRIRRTPALAGEQQQPQQTPPMAQDGKNKEKSDPLADAQNSRRRFVNDTLEPAK